jgi:hypothetical protein
MAARMEVTVDKGASRQKVLGLSGRFESLHLPLPPAPDDRDNALRSTGMALASDLTTPPSLVLLAENQEGHPCRGCKTKSS